MALPAVSEVFKGSIDESLKKLVQPAAIVPTTVLVALNFVIVYPPLEGAGFASAGWFADLDDLWKAVVLTATILVLGYVLLSLSPSIVRVASGEAFGNTVLGSASTWLERRRITSSSSHAMTTDLIRSEDARLPPPAQAAPTRLGNVLAGANWSVYQRYGFDMAALGVHLQVLLAKEDEKITASLDDEYAGLQVLLNLAAVTLLVGSEAGVLSLALRDGALALAFLISLPVAYGLYRAACAKARSYTDLVEVAVDIYRSKVGEKLGITATDDPAKDRAAWLSLRTFLLWDKRETPPADPRSTLTVTATTPDNVTVKALPVRLRDAPDVASTPGSVYASWVEEYAYLVGVKVPDECCNVAVSTQLVLASGSDWRWESAPHVEVNNTRQLATVLRGGSAGDALLVRTTIHGSSTADVRVAYPRRRVEVGVRREGEADGAVTVSFDRPPVLGAASIAVTLDSAADTHPVTVVFQATWMPTTKLVVRLGGSTIKADYLDGWWTAGAELPKGTSTLNIYFADAPPRKYTPPARPASPVTAAGATDMSTRPGTPPEVDDDARD